MFVTRAPPMPIALLPSDPARLASFTVIPHVQIPVPVFRAHAEDVPFTKNGVQAILGRRLSRRLHRCLFSTRERPRSWLNHRVTDDSLCRYLSVD